MDRRSFLGATTLPLLASIWPPLLASASAEAASDFYPASRVRPGDSAWASAALWERLSRETGGRLIKVQSPLGACEDAPDGASCREIFKALKNPYYIGDEVALTQTSGWIDAWSSQPSTYAVAARRTEDVVAGVNFARENNLRLVVKGGGYSYLGTSNAPDSLLIWTRAMNDITVHDDFVAEGCAGGSMPQPAVTIGAGAIWMHAYNEVTTKAGRYVQGGGCGTVGVAGLVQGGGFGSFSKNYGTAAASLLEAEVVTADGVVRKANACTNPDLFWALKGGEGGTFGVVTRLTLRTHELPASFGAVSMTINAQSDATFRQLLDRFVAFYAENLLNPRWGEIATLRRGNRLDVRMVFQGLGREQANAIWQPFVQWVTASPENFTLALPPRIVAGPARHWWDRAFLDKYAPGALLADDRPGASADNVFWAGNLSETGHFLFGFESVWLPASLLQADRREQFVDALFAASRHYSVELHFQKGLAGAPEEAIAAAKETCTNPAVLDAFALAIIAGEGPPAYPGLRGHEPNIVSARRNAGEIVTAMTELKKAVPDPDSYVAESSFFTAEWQKSYWGPHYPRLFSTKKKYDPAGLFFTHHGVGSEEWSADGFTRLARR